MFFLPPRQLPLSYGARDVKRINRQEEQCIQSSLELARRVDSAAPELVASVRATFWEAVTHPNASVHSLADVFANPHRWLVQVEVEAAACRADYYSRKDAELRVLCKSAFLNAATSLPVAVYGAGVRRLLISGKEVGVQAAVGRDTHMSTGMLKEVCLAVDSSHFLRGSAVKYIQDSYAALREKTFFPRFHARMTAWAAAAADTTFEVLMVKARAEWPEACPVHLADSVLQWRWQRAAYKAVAESALPVDVPAVVLKCSTELNMPCAAVEEAADWNVADAVESAACAAAYGPNLQWSYYRAVVEFYAALRSDTDVFGGVFNATRFLAELRLHRGVVVSRRMYQASLALHGVDPADLDAAVCNEVYAAMAAQNLH